MAIRTPTLIELWETAPYFHDGSAATLAEVFDVGAHQLSVSEADEADLIQFLLSIDQSMYIAVGFSLKEVGLRRCCR